MQKAAESMSVRANHASGRANSVAEACGQASENVQAVASTAGNSLPQSIRLAIA